MFRPYSFFAASTFCGLLISPLFGQSNDSFSRRMEEADRLAASGTDAERPPWPATAMEAAAARIPRVAPLAKPSANHEKGMVSVQELRNPISDEEARRLAAANVELNQGDSARGLERLQQATEKPSTAGYAHAMIGTFCLKNNDLTCALAQLSEAVRILPSLTSARSNLGYAFYVLGSLSDAERELRQAVALTPADPYPNFVLGVLLLTNPSRHEEAAERLRAAEVKFPRAILGRAVLSELNQDSAGASREIDSLSVNADMKRKLLRWVKATAAAERPAMDLLVTAAAD